MTDRQTITGLQQRVEQLERILRDVLPALVINHQYLMDEVKAVLADQPGRPGTRTPSE